MNSTGETVTVNQRCWDSNGGTVIVEQGWTAMVDYSKWKSDEGALKVEY